MSKPVLYILDVGHGNSAVLKDTEGIVVFDAGPRTGLLEFLREEGIERLDSVLISHADRDHIEGLISLVESRLVTIGRVRVNSDSIKKSDLWKDLLFLLEDLDKVGGVDFDVSLTSKHTGQFNCGSVDIEILAPSLQLAGMGAGALGPITGKRLSSNSMSVVFRLVYEGAPTVLLPGDLDFVGLTELQGRGVNLRSSVMVYPHHGGGSGAANENEFVGVLCDEVCPEIIIFSIGRESYANPKAEVVQRVKEVCKPRIACTQLAKECSDSLPMAAASHLTATYSRGKGTNSCCAGTLSVEFGSQSTVSPVEVSHTQFILNNVPAALCRQ